MVFRTNKIFKMATAGQSSERGCGDCAGCVSMKPAQTAALEMLRPHLYSTPVSPLGTRTASGEGQGGGGRVSV